MQSFSTFGETRRRRQRRLMFRGLRYVALAGFVMLAVVAAYEVGISQMVTEVDRLEQRVRELQEISRSLNERIADAEQRADQANEDKARIEQAYQRDVPQGLMKQFQSALAKKLEAGVPAERMAFIIGQAEAERTCDEEIETKRLAVQTPIATTPVGAISFLDERIAVTGNGPSARNEEGLPEAWFDSGQAIELRFLTVDGELETTQGPLPLSHAIVMAGKELQFLAKPSDKRGLVDITMQTCSFP